MPDGAVAREGPSRSAPGLPPRLGHIRGRAGRGPQHGVAENHLRDPAPAVQEPEDLGQSGGIGNAGDLSAEPRAQRSRIAQRISQGPAKGKAKAKPLNQVIYAETRILELLRSPKMT